MIDNSDSTTIKLVPSSTCWAIFFTCFIFSFLAFSFLWQMNRKNKNYSLHHKSSRNGFRDFLVTNFTIFVNTICYFFVHRFLSSMHKRVSHNFDISFSKFLLPAKTTMINAILFFFFFFNKKYLFYELAQKLDWNDTVSALILKTCY